MVRPMHQPTQFIPLVHSAHLYPVAHAQGYALGEVNIVRDEKRLPIADIDDEALMPRTLVVVRQQPTDEASDLDPATVIRFLEGFAHVLPMRSLLGAGGQRAIKNAADHPWLPRCHYLKRI